MMVPDLSENLECPRDEIASYIDGELSSPEEAVFEKHLIGCKICSVEIKHQKEFLFALNVSLESEYDIPLPKDFTRTIVATAESGVSGLRRPRELFTAIFICVALSFFVLFALGPDAETAWRAFGSVAEKTFAVGAFVLRLVFNIWVSIAVVMRSLFAHIGLSSMLQLPLIALFAAALFIISRSVIRNIRTQEN